MLSIYGLKVRNRLNELGITQKELAKKIGTSEVYLSYILNGKKGGWKYKIKINEILENSTNERLLKQIDNSINKRA